jgi:hypothetical protein
MTRTNISQYAGSVFIVLQCIFMYVPMSYPQVSIHFPSSILLNLLALAKITV